MVSYLNIPADRMALVDHDEGLIIGFIFSRKLSIFRMS